MSKNLKEHGFVSTIQQRTNNKDLQNCLFACFLSQEEPKKVWIEAMQEELLQFKLQEVWTLVDLPNRKRAIGSKWVFRNKKEEKRIVIRNKARLVAQWYTQEEGIDYDEVFAPVARIEAIRLFLAYASFKDFVVYQMDVKSTFLFRKIEEEVYVCQPPGFEDPDFPDRVYKKFGFIELKTASTPMETQKPLLKDEDGEEVDVHTYRSMIGSLMYLTSSRPDIMFVVCAYARYQVNPKVSHRHAVKRIFSDPYHTLIITQPSTSQPQKKQKPRKPKRKDTKIPQSSGPIEPIADEATNEKNVPIHSNDPLLNGDDSLKLNDLMEICTKLQQRVLDLENTKTAQAQEISILKLRVKRLEKKGGLRTHKLKRLFNVGRSAQVASSEDEGLGDQEDASKQGRKIDDIDQDAKVTLVDETQGRYDDAQMFDADVFNGEEVFVVEQSEKVVEEVVSTAEVSIAETITTKEITLAQALAELRSAKPKVVVQEPVQSTTITTPSTIPKAKSITFKDPGESITRTTLTPIPLNIKDKGKAKMIKPEKPLKKKEQIRLDEELAFKLQAEEEEQARLARDKAKKVKEANISWDNVLFVELLEKRKKHFAALRAQEKRNKPPTKAQKKSTMSTYLKHMAGYKQSQLKNKSFAEIQKLFDKAMTRVNMFVDMDTELVKESSKKAEAEMAQESSSKRAGEELEQEVAKKQKMEDDKEKEDLKQCFEIVQDDEVAIDAIPLATKPAVIVDYKIYRKGKQGYYEIIRADGSSKIYLLFSQLIKSFDREDLETL
ncbi:retrovirus-related pol polyprotein from transposon TNT 1-94 [Tanacetum coccineum]